MNRRKAIGGILGITGLGLASFTGFKLFYAPSAIDRGQLQRFENLLAELVYVIIPATETPGAKDARVQDYIIRFMESCSSNKEYYNFLSGLEDVQDTCLYDYSASFQECTIAQKTNVLEKHTLEKGDKITIQKEQISSEKIIERSPNWLNNMSVFKNKPLSVVLASLERQYNIKIKRNTVDVSKIFTGSFVHTNLESALKTTLPVMGIRYEVSKNQKTISLR